MRESISAIYVCPSLIYGMYIMTIILHFGFGFQFIWYLQLTAMLGISIWTGAYWDRKNQGLMA